jgi:hypothetical protein
MKQTTVRLQAGLTKYGNTLDELEISDLYCERLSTLPIIALLFPGMKASERSMGALWAIKL